MLNNRPKIALLSHEYPFGNSETSFIGPEIPYLDRDFDPQVIFTFPGQDEIKHEHPFQDVRVFDERSHGARPDGITRFRFWAWLFPSWLLTLLPQVIKGRLSVSKLRMLMAQFKKYLYMAQFLQDYLNKQPVDILYSYWFDHWNVAASIHRKLFRSQIKIVSRAHRYELDKKTAPLGFFPFRSIQVQNSDAVVFISSRCRSSFH